MTHVRKQIFTAAELSEFVTKIDAAHGADRDAALVEFEFILDNSSLYEMDPHSIAYRDNVLKNFNAMHSEKYSVSKEQNVFGYQIVDPYPFNSRSPFEVGRHFAAIFTILRDFPVSPPGRILDVGSGWGHTTLALARTGFHVDPLDINEGYLSLISEWAQRTSVSDRVQPINAPFDAIGDLPNKYDAILFFESFHHSLDHHKLIEDCAKILTEDGSVIFAGEPIFADWPLPWNVRTDAMATYCINKFGWMELGFREDYFFELMSRFGFSLEKRVYEENPIASGYVARRNTTEIALSSLVLPREYASTWHAPETAQRWTKGNSKLPGYLFYGKSAFELLVFNYRPAAADVLITGDNIRSDRQTVPAGQGMAIAAHIHGSVPEISIQSDVWNPSRHGLADTRDLGIAVQAIRFPR